MFARANGGSTEDLLSQARMGEPRSLARLLTLAETGEGIPSEALDASSVTAGSHIIGITGSPGVGKSTVTASLVRTLRERGHKVGVLAVDPSSPVSGGALLGDRLRMVEHTGDAGVFIRSMSARGQLGGLSAAVPRAAALLRAAGFDRVVLETVGVGQNEISVSSIADTTVILFAPGMGDGIQAGKAGLMEVGDIYIVNKSDLPGANQVARDLTAALALSHHVDGWRPHVLRTSATEPEGASPLADEIERHRVWLSASGATAVRAATRAESLLTFAIDSDPRTRAAQVRREQAIQRAARRVADGEWTLGEAADHVLQSFALEP